MPSDLWSFASACYARPGVEATCLQLQQQGQDVCLLLCALWLERRGIASNPARLQQLQDISRAWQRDVIEPLRSLRQNWREAALHDQCLARLRESIKATELAAEQELLQRLEQLATTWPTALEVQETLWLEQLDNDRDALQLLRAAASTL